MLHLPQKAAQTCKFCGEVLGKYYCNICHFWCNDETINQFISFRSLSGPFIPPLSLLQALQARPRTRHRFLPLSDVQYLLSDRGKRQTFVQREQTFLQLPHLRRVAPNLAKRVHVSSLRTWNSRELLKRIFESGR